MRSQFETPNQDQSVPKLMLGISLELEFMVFALRRFTSTSPRIQISDKFADIDSCFFNLKYCF